jgi:hypothetical protein
VDRLLVGLGVGPWLGIVDIHVFALFRLFVAWAYRIIRDVQASTVCIWLYDECIFLSLYCCTPSPPSLQGGKHHDSRVRAPGLVITRLIV